MLIYATIKQFPLINRPTLEEIRSWGSSFDKLMKNPSGRKIFRDFLKCEYSEENILFWLACEELKKETNSEAIEEKSRLIYDDYISILSPKEVCLLSTFFLFFNLYLTIFYLTGIIRFSCERNS